MIGTLGTDPPQSVFYEDSLSWIIEQVLMKKTMSKYPSQTTHQSDYQRQTIIVEKASRRIYPKCSYKKFIIPTLDPSLERGHNGVRCNGKICVFPRFLIVAFDSRTGSNTRDKQYPNRTYCRGSMPTFPIKSHHQP